MAMERCQFWCQFVLRVCAVSCAVVLFDGP
jgi:hypothetical protein